MSGLLQRLAGQAMRAMSAGGGGGPDRIRSAASVHQRVPLGAVPQESAGTSEVPRQPELAREGPAKDARTPDRDPAPREFAAQTAPSPLTTRSLPVPDFTMPASRSETRPSSHPAGTTHQPEVRSVTSAAPARLLQEVPVVRADTVGMAARVAEPRLQFDAPRNAAARTPTEVHVHIGRIEVSAAGDPAPRKPRVPASRPTRDLSDYLSRSRS